MESPWDLRCETARGCGPRQTKMSVPSLRFRGNAIERCDGKLLRTAGPLATRPHDAGGVQSQVGQEFIAVAVLDVAIGDAETADVAGVKAGVGGRLQAPHCRTRPSTSPPRP